MLLAVLFGFGARSQEPPINDAPSNQPAQPPTPDQRGTDEIPLTVKVLPAPGAQEKAEKEEHERKEKAIIDEKIAFETQRIADYTSRLALFTVFLFCVAVAQAALFIWQLLLIQWGAKETKDAVEAAKASAEAAKLSAEALMSADRAHLFIIFDGDNAKNEINNAASFFGEPDLNGILPRTAVGFKFKNHGKSFAVLTSLCKHLDHVPRNAHAMGLNTSQDFPPGQVLDIGQTTAEESCQLATRLTVADAKAIARGESMLRFYGYVWFKDVFGREYEWSWEHQFAGDGWRLIHYEEKERPKH